VFADAIKWLNHNRIEQNCQNIIEIFLQRFSILCYKRFNIDRILNVKSSSTGHKHSEHIYRNCRIYLATPDTDSENITEIIKLGLAGRSSCNFAVS